MKLSSVDFQAKHGSVSQTFSSDEKSLTKLEELIITVGFLLLNLKKMLWHSF